MQSPRSTIHRSALALAMLLCLQLDAVAATGVTACDSRLETASAHMEALHTSRVDYNTERTSDSAAAILREPPAIESKALTLTPDVDTTVLRDDHVKSDLELPLDEKMESRPDAAALLLQRRNERIRSTADDEATEDMNTELPGMNEDEMLQFRDRMYRTDI